MIKLFRMFFRSIRDAFKSVSRNFSLSLASITCITITLLIVSIAAMASFNIDKFAKEIAEDVTMVVFLESDVDEVTRNQMQEMIGTLDNVSSIELKSKEMTKEEMKTEYPELSTVIDGWTDEENPLKDSFLIKVKEITEITETKNTIEKMGNIYYIDYGESIVEPVIETLTIVERVAYVIVLALIVVTVFLIINTIKLAIFSRKREISIMRLVGASNFSIKTPFVVEGMVLGLIGSVIPIFVTCYGYMAVSKNMGGQLFTPVLQLIPTTPFIYFISLGILILGMLVGMFGSWLAVRRYLKI